MTIVVLEKLHGGSRKSKKNKMSNGLQPFGAAIFVTALNCQFNLNTAILR
jgi:hypothetical protein